MKLKTDILRAKRLIENAIESTQLDLSGLNILTEVGSNHFIYTPIIASMAGAEKVFAWTKDTSYGKGSNIVNECKNIVSEFSLNDNITFSINNRPDTDISNANIITNLGFIRPINKSFIDNISQGSVISYMCEAWEVRAEDVDINYVKTRNIKIAGTWENYPGLDIFDGCGYLMAKLCFEAGFEIYQNKILIISNDHFGDVAYSTLKKFSPQIIDLVTTEDVSSLNSETNYDFIIVADYTSKEVLIGNNGKIPQSILSKIGTVVHLCGNIDKVYCDEHQIVLYPDKKGDSKRMSETLAYLGPKPLIDLHTAGLKVGELLFKNKTSKLVQYI